MCHACLNALAELRKIENKLVADEHGKRVAARHEANRPWGDPSVNYRPVNFDASGVRYVDYSDIEKRMIADCYYCKNEAEPGRIETDNNGPIVPCPVCADPRVNYTGLHE
jgi:hypothetical protein